MNILTNVNLSQHTSIGIGGIVKYLLMPTNRLQIIEALKFIKDQGLPYFILGGGTNTVFADQELEYNQIVLCLKAYKEAQIIAQNEKSQTVFFSSGYQLQELVDYSKENKLKGLINLNWIPGTFGGAVFGNAGAYGTEIVDTIQSVTAICLDKNSEKYKFLDTFEIAMKDCEFGYRTSYFKNHSGKFLILGSTIKLQKITSQEEVNAQNSKYEEIKNIRSNAYPLGMLTPGSMFKNLITQNLGTLIPNPIPAEFVIHGNKVPAGKLLEHTVGKNYGLGAIHTKPTHANILVNDGDGDFYEVKQVVKNIIREVKDKYQVELDPEIRLVESFNNYL
jgi:UDP-N-acetylmuramate dehydrogenase